MEQIQPKQKYSYKDYKNWNTGLDRYELFEGEPRMMSSPSQSHQFLSDYLMMQFMTQLLGTQCIPHSAPSDVRLFPKADESDDIILQPDIYITYEGVPRIVIEILSPSNTAEEMEKKLRYYTSAGVKEYWIFESEYFCSIYGFNPSLSSYEYRSYTSVGGILEIVTYSLCKDISVKINIEDIPVEYRTPQLRLL